MIQETQKIIKFSNNCNLKKNYPNSYYDYDMKTLRRYWSHKFAHGTVARDGEFQ